MELQEHLRSKVLHDGCHVVASVAVVGSRPDSHQVARLEPELEALLYQLMRPGDQLQSVDVVEIPDDFGAENPSCSSVVGSPSLDVFGVGPHQITEGAYIRTGVP